MTWHFRRSGLLFDDVLETAFTEIVVERYDTHERKTLKLAADEVSNLVDACLKLTNARDMYAGHEKQHMTPPLRRQRERRDNGT